MFRYDSKLMEFLGKLADLMILNFLALIISLPVFTIGAVQTALHYSSRCLLKNEGSAWSNFFHSFKMNFRQITPISLVFSAICFLFAVDWYFLLVQHVAVSPLLVILLILGEIFTLAFTTWFYALQSRYSNPIRATAKNALKMMLFHPFRSLGMSVLTVVFFLLPLFFSYLLPLAFLFGGSLLNLVFAKIYLPVFEKLEKQPEEAAE